MTAYLSKPANLSRLGFGLSGIAGSGNFSHQQKLIRTAIDCGATHFDTAPYYGAGDAEKILGDILAKCPEKVTITTKFGLVPLSGGGLGRLARSVLRPVFRKMRSLKSLATKVTANVHKPSHVQEHIEKSALVASLDASLQKLRRPVDIFLLHEPSLTMVRHPAVLAGLAELCQTGKTTRTGVSGATQEVTTAVREYPHIYQVAQLENSLPHPAPMSALAVSGSQVITYRAVQSGLKELNGLLAHRPEFKKQWQREIGLDPASPDILAQVLIELALSENPAGTVLFSTTRPERIVKICRAVHEPLLSPESFGKLRQLFEAASSLPR
jgi:D-threo-aldose 1-dehydrogenase